MADLYQRYVNEIRPTLQNALGVKNVMQVPKIEKVTLNMAESGVAAGDEGLPAGAIVGIVVSFVLAALLLMIALPFILPKPPGK